MRKLQRIRPTAQQLQVVQNVRPGVHVIRGAAGSGKTTTALLRVKQLAATWLSRRLRTGSKAKVRILVITYNRTLRGYIAALAGQQVQDDPNLELTVSTFSKWAKDTLALPGAQILSDNMRSSYFNTLPDIPPLDRDSLLQEVDYVLGRFLPSDLEEYIGCERTGRGLSPRVDRATRRRILSEAIIPYAQWKSSLGGIDWNDFATQIISFPGDLPKYDVIIADEVQDLSANQVRALMEVAADPSSTTFILDAAQRIYPRGFTWSEVGVSVGPNNSHRLGGNYRNTVEICQFAVPLLKGMEIGEDGTLPSLSTCERHGEKPVVLSGRFSGQVEFVMRYLRENVDLELESVAFLHPRAGNWLAYLRRRLKANSMDFVELTREDEWPDGPENIAISTMHSSKGLEFDHVIILGLSAELTPHGPEPHDARCDTLRRLLAMSIMRARCSVIIGYKPSEASSLIAMLDQRTYRAVDV